MGTLLEYVVQECRTRTVMIELPPSKKKLVTGEDVLRGFEGYQKTLTSLDSSTARSTTQVWPPDVYTIGRRDGPSSSYELVKNEDGSPVYEMNKDQVKCAKYKCTCGGEVLFKGHKDHITRKKHEDTRRHQDEIKALL